MKRLFIKGQYVDLGEGVRVIRRYTQARDSAADNKAKIEQINICDYGYIN